MYNDTANTDEDLLLTASVKKGDQKAFSLLYDKYAPALLGIISKIIDEREEAEETLSQTFMAAWSQIVGFDAYNTSLFSWLLALARKTALEKAATENRQFNKDVYKAVKNGAPGKLYENKDNSAFDLIYYKGASCAEAAAIMNITVDELRSDIRKSIQCLKENKKHVDQ